MKLLKSGQFWAGVLVGYLVLVAFPQLNVRSMSGKKKKGLG